MKKIIFIVAFLLFIPVLSFAQISFDANGKWETTFDCAEASWGSSGSPACDGVTSGGSPHAGMPNSQITSGANNPAGGGGRGARFWMADLDPNTGNPAVNLNSSPAGVTFPVLQKEIWVRFYTRYQEGFKWVREYPLDIHYDKMMYFWDHNNSPLAPLEYLYRRVRMHNPGGGDMQTELDIDWRFVNGSPYGHGNWNCHEIYLKMDTDGTNGVAMYWLNGVLRGDKQDMNYSAGVTARRDGFKGFHFTSNQGLLDNLNGPIESVYAYVDYDDMVIYNQIPPNVDAHGNPMIGPLGWGGTCEEHPSNCLNATDCEEAGWWWDEVNGVCLSSEPSEPGPGNGNGNGDPPGPTPLGLISPALSGTIPTVGGVAATIGGSYE